MMMNLLKYHFHSINKKSWLEIFIVKPVTDHGIEGLKLRVSLVIVTHGLIKTRANENLKNLSRRAPEAFVGDLTHQRINL